jgi:hypothetical protein
LERRLRPPFLSFKVTKEHIMKKQTATEGKEWVTPSGKTFTHATAGTLVAGKSYEVDSRTAGRLLRAGLVNPSSEEYSTKVIQRTPVVGNADSPSVAAGGNNQSSASQVAQASTQTTVNKSGSGATKKKRGR